MQKRKHFRSDAEKRCSNCSKVCIVDFQEDSHLMANSIYVSFCSSELSKDTYFVAECSRNKGYNNMDRNEDYPVNQEVILLIPVATICYCLYNQ